MCLGEQSEDGTLSPSFSYPNIAPPPFPLCVCPSHVAVHSHINLDKPTQSDVYLKPGNPTLWHLLKFKRKKKNPHTMCCLCSVSLPAARTLFCQSTSFPAVPLLHLKVCFYIPSHTTFPTKMAPLRNSLSSQSQHDLLV